MIYRGEKEKRGDSFLGAARIGGSSGGKAQKKQEKTNCNQDCPGAFSTISYASSYYILDDSLMVLSIYFADWA